MILLVLEYGAGSHPLTISSWVAGGLFLSSSQINHPTGRLTSDLSQAISLDAFKTSNNIPEREKTENLVGKFLMSSLNPAAFNPLND